MASFARALRPARYWILGVAWALCGCGTEPSTPAAGSERPPGTSALAGVSHGQPLEVMIERRTLRKAVDAKAQELSIRWSGAELELQLERNDSLVSADYTTFEVDASGVLRERSAAERPPFCHYQGFVRNDDGTAGGAVSMTTCDAAGREAFVGLLWDDARLIELRPAPGDAHRYELVQVERPSFIDDLSSPVEVESGPWLSPQAVGPTGPNGELWIETITVNDQRRLSALGSIAAVENSSLSITNMLAGLYYGSSLVPPVRFGLKAQVTFTTDPYTPAMVGMEADPSDLLAKFSSWGAEAALPAHDHRQLFSGFNFQSTTVGLAYIAAICKASSSASMVQATFSAVASAQIGAHELGHSLGLAHDQETGCGSGFIMSQSVCVGCSMQPDAFSSCSQDGLDALLAGSVTCLANPITTTFNGPTCGNGIVESGEQCDCAEADCTESDPCCNGSSCQLAPQALCSANDACCNPGSCQPRAPGTLCRPGASSCDQAESCDGGAKCPADTFLSAGQTCNDGLTSAARCYQGHCQSREHQCAALELSFPTVGSLVPCSGSGCGVMFCRQVSTGICYEFTGYDFEDGTPCAPVKQCLNDACVNSSELNPPAGAAAVPALHAPARLALPLLLLGLGFGAFRRRARR